MPLTYAVLVGLDGYAELDASQGLPPGTSDNRGAVWDAYDWFLFLRALGVPHANIRFLGSRGRDTREEFPGAERLIHRGRATGASVLAAAAWLSARLEEPEARGLFVWSGHSEVVDDTLCLLTAETVWRRGAMTGGVRIPALVRALGGDRHRETLTLILDTCHAGYATDDRMDRVRRPHGRRGKAGIAPCFPFRALVASGPAEPSYEIPVGRGWRGAFSWSTLRVLQRWGVNDSGVEIAYDELARRSATLLDALGVAQAPAYAGPPELSGTAFFLPRAPRGDGPTLSLGEKELDPGTCDVVGRDGEPVGVVYAAPTSAADAWPDDWVCWWSDTGAPNPFLTLDHFDLVRSTRTPAPPAVSPWMEHANGVFGAYGGVLPTCARWYRWQRARPGGPQLLGWIGVNPPGASGEWTLAWLSVAPLFGRAKLAFGEHFLLDLVNPAEITGVLTASIDVFPG